jgi:hypothetical protein
MTAANTAQQLRQTRCEAYAASESEREIRPELKEQLEVTVTLARVRDVRHGVGLRVKLNPFQVHYSCQITFTRTACSGAVAGWSGRHRLFFRAVHADAIVNANLFDRSAKLR